MAAICAACGSGNKSAALVATDMDFVTCLSGYPNDFTNASSGDADDIARTAAAYSGLTTADDNHASVSIWNSTGDAQTAEDSYRAFQPGALERRSNVVIAWDSRPTHRQSAELHLCVFGSP